MKRDNFSEPKLIIAIDGPAAAGKSTVARLLAKTLGYSYIDTGIMYRAVAWIASNQDTVLKRKEAVSRLMQKFKITFSSQGEQFKVLADGADVTLELRSPKIGQLASTYSAMPAVRSYLTELQRSLGRKGGVVMEGRDIGTVVLPEADYKFFLWANAQERGRRRFEELSADGKQVDLNITIEQLSARDNQDTNRQLAPLRQAQDAIIIDSTRLTAKQVVEQMLTRIIRAA